MSLGNCYSLFLILHSIFVAISIQNEWSIALLTIRIICGLMLYVSSGVTMAGVSFAVDLKQTLENNSKKNRNPQQLAEEKLFESCESSSSLSSSSSSSFILNESLKDSSMILKNFKNNENNFPLNTSKQSSNVLDFSIDDDVNKQKLIRNSLRTAALAQYVSMIFFIILFISLLPDYCSSSFEK